MTNFVKFPSIEKFSDVVKTARYHGIEKTTYISKVKLHGTNAAIRFEGGKVFFQKRSADVTIHDDNAGFANWAINIPWTIPDLDCIVYGEWAGPGIQKGDAVSSIPQKTFFPFAIYNIDTNEWWNDYHSLIWHTPNHNQIKVIPDFGVYEVDFTSYHSLEKFTEQVNREVEQIGEEDPFIKQEYGVSGPGEGLVFTSLDDMRLSFKAKTEAHSVNKTRLRASKDVEVPENVKAFVDMFVTQQRIDQMIQEHFPNGPSMKDMGQFLKVMNADIIKESKNELEESALTWKDVNKEVTKMAVAMFSRMT